MTSSTGRASAVASPRGPRGGFQVHFTPGRPAAVRQALDALAAVRQANAPGKRTAPARSGITWPTSRWCITANISRFDPDLGDGQIQPLWAIHEPRWKSGHHVLGERRSGLGIPLRSMLREGRHRCARAMNGR